MSLTELKPADYKVIDSHAVVREDSDLTKPQKTGKKLVEIPNGTDVHVSEYQHGALKAHDGATDSAQGYGVYAKADGYGWTLLANLKAVPPKKE